MPDNMTIVVLRYIAGFLLQVAPCAVLCFAPFWGSLRFSYRKTLGIVACALALTCVPCLVLGVMPFGRFEQVRYAVNDACFLTMLVLLLMVLWRLTEASRAQKTFVFLLAMTYGCLLMMMQHASCMLLGILDSQVDDGYMYPVEKLCVHAALTLITFPAVWVLMARIVRDQLLARNDDRVWWRMCVIPAAVVAVLVFGGWIPVQLRLSERVADGIFVIGIIAGSIALCVYHFISVQRFGEVVGELDRAVEERDELSRHVEALSRKQDEDLLEPVTFETPVAVVTFDPREALYLEVYGHTLVIHFADGRAERVNVSLSKARELLPQDMFVQCHRSYLVNKVAVRSLRRYEATLSSGERIPVSKQRYRDVADALAGEGAG